jgi:hypothetical protein
MDVYPEFPHRVKFKRLRFPNWFSGKVCAVFCSKAGSWRNGVGAVPAGRDLRPGRNRKESQCQHDAAQNRTKRYGC